MVKGLFLRGEFDLVPFAFGEEGVEAQDELVIAAKQIFHSFDHSGSVNGLRFEVLHYVEELVVDLRLVGELHLHLV